MKITPLHNAKDSTTADTKATTKRLNVNSNAAASGTPDEESLAATGATGRDFASVLEDLMRPRDKQDAPEGEDVESQGSEERQDAKSGERTERKRDGSSEQREGSRGEGDGSNGNFDRHAGGVREIEQRIETTTTTTTNTSARQIIHIADLEKMVAAVRTQILAGNRHEVTLELKRSVLEGLRVKLSADAGGRITAEFIAASEKVRAQLDARASDLTDLLRTRGVDLAAMRTTLEAQTSNQNREDGGANRSLSSWPETKGTNGIATNASVSLAPTGASPEGDSLSPEDKGTTYRA